MNENTLKKICELRDYCEKLNVFNISSEISFGFANTVEIKLVHKLPGSLKFVVCSKLLGIENFDDCHEHASKDVVRDMAYGIMIEVLGSE